MLSFEEDQKAVHVYGILDQIESFYADLRFEYTEMVKAYDDALARIEELESDKLYLSDLLAEPLEAGV